MGRRWRCPLRRATTSLSIAEPLLEPAERGTVEELLSRGDRYEPGGETWAGHQQARGTDR